MTAHEAALARAEEANAALAATRNDRWYPTFHVAPPAGWINDPNGLCFHGGRYHAFYQHFPDAPAWGPMHWGHASSADLITWRREPIALAPSRDEDAGGVWSGSAVTADNGSLTLFYTGNRWVNGVDDAEGLHQVQCVATSTDGVHFTPGPVVVDGPGPGRHVRDPKVWRDGDTWWMTLGVSSEDGRGQVWQYRSADLHTWEFDRVVYTHPDPAVYMLECPDLFPLGDHWVLLIGPMTTARPSGYAGRNGHNCGYVVGDRTPEGEFVPLTEYRIGDWGHHYYAPQSFVAPDGRRIVFGWMGAFTLPLASAADGWSGQLSVPRELTLRDDLTLCARPVAELASLRTESVDHGAFELRADEQRILLDDAQAFEVELTVDLAASTAEQIGLEVHRTAPGRCTYVAYDDLARRVMLDRRTTNATPGDGGMRSAPHEGDTLSLRVLVDRGSVEVFVGDGAATLSSLSFPDDGPRTLALVAVAGTAQVTSLRVHRLGSGVEAPATA